MNLIINKIGRINWFWIVLALLTLLSCTQADIQKKDPLIESISNQVTRERMNATIRDMVNFKTRYTYEKQLQVAEYLYNAIQKYIERTQYHEYESWGVSWKNVEATLPGLNSAKEIVIVFAHMDSISDKRLAIAPGADDDASGCAAVLEIARLLSSHHFEKTIKFVIFSREEDGHEGSKAYVKDLKKNGVKIIAAINLDMIAYGNNNADLYLMTRPSYASLVKKVDNLARIYGFNTNKVIKKGCA
jgi:bacterial leucyl aminopeptidase